MMPGGGGGGGHGHHGGGGHGGHPHGGGGAFCDIVASTAQERQDTKPLDIIIGDKDDKDGTILDASEAVPLTAAKSEDDEEEDDTPSSSDKKQHDDFIEDGEEDDDEVDLQKQYDDSHIIRATKKDYFFTGFLIVVMASLVGVVVGWPTHLDESDSIFG